MRQSIIFSILLFCCFYSGAAQDRSLAWYIQQAQSSSPLLKDYQRQLESIGLDSQLIRASFLPQVNGISNNAYAPVLRGFGYDNAISNGGQLSAQVQVTKTMIGNEHLATQLRSLALDKNAVTNSAGIARRDLKKNIAMQYIVTYGDMMTMDFNKETLQLLQKEEQLLKSLTQGNVYKQSDYLTFYVTLQQQRLVFRQSEIQYRSDLLQLNYLSGVNDTSLVNLPDPHLQLTPIPPAQASIFYQPFTTDSLRNINQREVIRYSYKPKLNVFGDAGYLSSLAYEAQKNFGASVGLTLSVPIYDGRQKQLKLKKIDIAERTREDYRDYFIRQYSQQIAQLQQQLAATESLISEIDGQIKYSKTLIDINAKLLEGGNVRITDLVLAIDTYLNARNLLNQNYINRLQLLNQIEYWQTL